MNKTGLSSLFVASAFSEMVSAAELPQVGSCNLGTQVSFGNIDHDNLNNDNDGAGQVMLTTILNLAGQSK